MSKQVEFWALLVGAQLGTVVLPPAGSGGADRRPVAVGSGVGDRLRRTCRHVERPARAVAEGSKEQGAWKEEARKAQAESG